jgi:hypothetical protein
MLPVKKTTDTRFPTNTFVTYSSDGSVKFWNLHPNRTAETRKIGGKELLHQFYPDSSSVQHDSRRELGSYNCIRVFLLLLLFINLACFVLMFFIRIKTIS